MPIHEYFPEEIFPLGDTGESYKFINIVMTASPSNPINQDVLFNFLPIVEIENFDRGDKKKLSIPYYGHEEIFISLTHGKLSRGIRKINNALKAILYADYQYNLKNQHAKISKDNIHITGVRSEETGMRCITSIVEKIEIVYNIVKSIRGLPDKDDLYSSALAGEEDIELDEELQYYTFITANSSRPDYEEFLKELFYGSTNVYETTNDNTGPLSVDSFKIHVKVYYIHMGHVIDLCKLNEIAIENGHRAIMINFVNVKSTKIVVKIPGTDNEICFKVFIEGGINFCTPYHIDDIAKTFALAKECIKRSYIKVSGDKRPYVRRTPRGHI